MNTVLQPPSNITQRATTTTTVSTPWFPVLGSMLSMSARPASHMHVPIVVLCRWVSITAESYFHYHHLTTLAQQPYKPRAPTHHFSTLFPALLCVPHLSVLVRAEVGPSFHWTSLWTRWMLSRQWKSNAQWRRWEKRECTWFRLLHVTFHCIVLTYSYHTVIYLY